MALRSSRRPVADGLGIYRPHFAHAGKILLGAGFQRCMTLKGGSSVGLQAAGENVDLTTNAEEQADAKALKEKMQARPVNSPAPAGNREDSDNGGFHERFSRGRDDLLHVLHVQEL